MKVKIVIDGKQITAEKGEIILSVARREGFDIPSLCFHEAFENGYGACRLCIVEVIKGNQRGLTTSCTLKAEEGLEILTSTPEIERHRRTLLELYLAQAPSSDLIKELASRYGVEKTRFPKRFIPGDPLGNKCVLCGLCVRACGEIMKAGAINYIGRGTSTEINTPFFEENPDCLGCGACAHICPTGAIDLEDINSTRVLKSWSNTKVKLKVCEICGTPFLPEPIWGKFSNLIDRELIEELERICPECRKSVYAKRLTAPFQAP